MIDFGIPLIFSSFLAGLFTFFAPCTLPLVPAFLGIISGVPQDELQNREALKKFRGRIFANAVFYVIGFSIIFILFGVAFSFLGKIFFVRILIQRLGGVLVILLGLFLLGWLKIPWLSAEKQIRIPKLFQSVSKFNSFSIGALFALGWSPCVGPLLGAILLLASGSGTILEGTVLLIVFSLGLAIPFLLMALVIGRAFSALSKWGGTLKVINIAAGIFLLAVGVLLLSGQFTSIFGQFRGWLQQFQFYEEYINKFL